MSRKRFSPQEIIGKLREAEVLLSRDMTVSAAVCKLASNEQTYIHGKRDYRGSGQNPGQKTKRTEKVNLQLKKLVADLSLDNATQSGTVACTLHRYATALGSQGGALKKVISPDRRREAVEQVQCVLDVSERRACRVMRQPRGTQRYKKRPLDDEEQLRERIVYLASRFGRYPVPSVLDGVATRRVSALLQAEGWRVNHKRVERIWRQEGLKVPQKQPKRGRLWLNDGSTVRLRPEFAKHVWSYHARPHPRWQGFPDLQCHRCIHSRMPGGQSGVELHPSRRHHDPVHS